MDYDARMKEARKLIDQGMYTQSMMTLGKILESLYTDFYQDLLAALPPAQRKVIADREATFTSSGFAGLSLGGKGKFFHDNDVVGEAERLLQSDFPHFRRFDSLLFRDRRNSSTHGQDNTDTEEESMLFYSQVRMLLIETAYLKKPEPQAPLNALSGLRSWKENGAVPHQDILDGNLQMNTYAADLWGVARKDRNTPMVYRDARQFFAQTYLTEALYSLLQDVFKGLTGGHTDRVLQLRTPFGGGKTHALIALYHVTLSRAEIAQDESIRARIDGLPDPGHCAVAAIQCEKFGARTGRMTDDGLHIHTLWGELAYQLAGAEGYAYLQVYDEGLTAPGGEQLTTLLREIGSPVLILLDEVLNHVETAQTIQMGESTLGRQVMIFLKNLTEAVAGSQNVVLVYSLQASIGEAMGAENLLSMLDHLVSRVDAKREPVTGIEIMGVVQRRLFQNLGDKTAAQQIAQSYADAYKRARQAAGGLSSDDQHRVAQEAESVAERIMQSYPLHPDLLDLMYHRWGSLPSYQRTRGALQFLASVVYDLWHAGRDLQPLISAGDVPLEANNTRNAFFSQVGQRESYSSVMDADVTGTNAGAKKVDARMASDSPALQRYRIGTRISTAVMLYSFGAREGEDRGVSEADLITATLTPGLDRLSLTTALNDLRQGMLYLHYTGRRYRFETMPNLNKLIDDIARELSTEEVLKRVQATFEKPLRDVQGAVIWPEHSGRVNDRVALLQIIYLPLEWSAFTDEERQKKLTEWLEYAGSTRREYKNGLAFALPGYSAAETLRSVAREALAIETLTRDRRFTFNDEQKGDLRERGNRANERLTNGVISLYEKVAVPVSTERAENEQPYGWQILELQSRNESTPHNRIVGALRDAYRVFETVTPDKLVALTGLNQSGLLEIGAVVGWFFSFLNFARLIDARPIRAAIARGVGEGKLGYSALVQMDGDHPTFSDPTLVYVGRSISIDEIDLSGAHLIEAALARQGAYVPTPDAPIPDVQQVGSVPSGSVSTSPSTSAANGTTMFSRPTPSGKRTHYTLTARVDKKQFFKLFRAVQNLTEKADRLLLTVEIHAESDAGFDPVWLRNAVEEPLDEANIDANVSLA